MRCNNISASGSKCFRRREENSDFCNFHIDASTRPTTQYLNDECPVCMEETGEMYPLPCFHRAHLKCLSGMTKLECPYCRAYMSNLPIAIRKNIEKNGEEYKEEVHEAERQEILELLERERTITERLPPQVELMLAMKYVFELGIPLHMIPSSVVIEIDAESPLPDPGSIFQNAVKRILTLIQTHVVYVGEEENDSFGDSDSGDTLDDDLTYSEEESLFELEGDDLQIIHQIQTIPAPGNRNEISLRIPAMFTTINFNLREFGNEFGNDIL
jgi:hypothetical protein